MKKVRRRSRPTGPRLVGVEGRLQEAMRLLREHDFGVALQFGNYRRLTRPRGFRGGNMLALAGAVLVASRPWLRPPSASGPGAAPVQGQPVNADAKLMAEFEERVKAYSALHRKLEATLPNLPKEPTPEQIDASAALTQLMRGRAAAPDRATSSRRTRARCSGATSRACSRARRAPAQGRHHGRESRAAPTARQRALPRAGSGGDRAAAGAAGAAEAAGGPRCTGSSAIASSCTTSTPTPSSTSLTSAPQVDAALRIMRRCLAIAVACWPCSWRCRAAAGPGRRRGAGGPQRSRARPVELPNREGSLKFGVLGDFGTGSREQYELGDADGQRARAFPVRARHHRRRQPVRGAAPAGFPEQVREAVQGAARRRREVLRVARQPRRAASSALQAVQHGREALLHVQGAEENVRFFALDSTYPDRRRSSGSRRSCRTRGEDWKIPFFHHPLYSSGERHGSDADLRERLDRSS